METPACARRAPANVRCVPRFVADAEVAAYFRRADLVVLPYREIDQSGVLFTALAFGAPLVLSARRRLSRGRRRGAAALRSPSRATRRAARRRSTRPRCARPPAGARRARARRAVARRAAPRAPTPGDADRRGATSTLSTRLTGLRRRRDAPPTRYSALLRACPARLRARPAIRCCSPSSRACGAAPVRVPAPAPQEPPTVSLIVAAYDEAGGDRATRCATRWRSTTRAERLEVDRRLRRIARDATVAEARRAGADSVLELAARRQDPRAGRGRRPVARRASSRSRTPTAAGSPTRCATLVAAFDDPAVGYVCGQVTFVSGSTGGTNQEGLYWRYEMALRALESKLASITAGNGAIYATRREAYIERRPDHGPRPLVPLQHGQARLARGLRAAGAGDREDGALAGGRVRPQAADDEPHLADRPARRPDVDRAATRRSTR